MRVLTLLFPLLIACGGSAKGPPPAPPPREVEIFTVQKAPVRETGEYLGSLLSRATVNVLPQVSGYVRKIHVRPGQKVTEGTVLLELDARQESAALESARAQQESAASGLELARQTLARTEALYKEGLANAQELERARAALASAEATQKTAGAQVSQRRVQLQYYDVRAPFAGTIGDVLVKLGDYVTGTAVLTTLAQADVLEVTVAIPPARARAVKLGTPLELLTDDGKVVTTEVFYVGPQADPRTQLVDVKAVFRNEAGFRPSELVRARLVYATREALQVPALAVIRQGGQPFVFAVVDNGGRLTVQRRPVTLGELGAQNYVIEKGLAPGDRIAASSIQALRDGAPIRPKAPVAKAP